MRLFFVVGLRSGLAFMVAMAFAAPALLSSRHSHSVVGTTRLPSGGSAQVRGVSAGAGRRAEATRAAEDGERFRLHNIAPQPGSRRDRKRIGRGYGAGQGGSCGMGMRGQKSRSGSMPYSGFEGGQMPLYRRLPKLKGIAGGMAAGRPKFITVNLRDIARKFSDGETVSKETCKEKRIINPSGYYRDLPLKVLGEGDDLPANLTFEVAALSAGAQAKVEEKGGTVNLVPQKPKWVRANRRGATAAPVEA